MNAKVSAEDGVSPKKSPIEERLVVVYATIRIKPKPETLSADDENNNADKAAKEQLSLDQAVKDRLGLGGPRRVDGFEDGDSAVDHGEVLDDLQGIPKIHIM